MGPVSKQGNSRVCDRCIRNKVKCNLQRPQCSRCLEGGYPCIYSAERRKPGPPRGSRRQPSAARAAAGTPNENLSPTSLHAQLEHDCSTATDSRSRNYDEEINFDVSPYIPLPEFQSTQSLFLGYTLSPEQERILLTEFFDEIHHAIPLFEKNRFLQLYDSGKVRRDLVVTITAITAKILGPVHDWNSQDLVLCLDSLLTLSQASESVHKDQVELESFQQECLLAFYDFHQFPGPQAWMRIARLSRRAYSVGLHQIENPELCSAFDFTLASEGTAEDWRFVWWCVYCLDSYSNISSGVPFIVDEQSMNTALPRRPFNESAETSWATSSPKLFLPDDTSELWNIAQEIASQGTLVGFRLHMVVTTMIRQAGTILRLRGEKGPGRPPARIAALKRNLASLRLALPVRYLNPARNVLNTETAADHHVRLTNIFLLHVSRIMLSLPGELSAGEEEWMENWQHALEASEDIVQIVEQWDSRFSAHVDPAICFTVFIALVMLDLHRRSRVDETPESATTMSQSERILLLFLEQFGNLWTLPRFLARVFKDWQDVHPASLTPATVDRILRRFKPPLHPKFGRSYQDVLEGPVSIAFLDPNSIFSASLWDSDEPLNFDMSC